MWSSRSSAWTGDQQPAATPAGLVVPIRSEAHIAYLDISDHHRCMIETAWQLGGLPAYESLGLRRWAHMLGFRGHFLTKFRRYSLTFTELRHRRRAWRLLDDLAHHPITDNAADTVIVINDWRVTAIGHRNDTVERVGLSPGFHVHDLRHTGNQLAAEAGATTRELMRRMGHSTHRPRGHALPALDRSSRP